MKVIVNNLEKEEVIDWGKVQLVISKVTGAIYLTLDSETNNRNDKFNAVDISDGQTNAYLIKDNFEPFHGSITLQND